MLATGRILSNAAADDDDDAGGWSGNCVTVYTFASYQGCNDIHVSLKCAADVRVGEHAGDNQDTGSD